MLEKDPDQRMGLLEFMDLPYYRLRDDEMSQQYNEVVEARALVEAAEEEKRNEEQKLVQQFDATLNIPSWSASGTGGSSVGRRNQYSPARVVKKKKKTGAAAATSGSSPRSGAAGASTTASRTYKNKKTTK